MADLIITIDGPAGSGKSTVARLLASRLGASFLDTGAMYRAVTLAAMQAGVDMCDQQQLICVLDSKKFEFTSEDDKMVVLMDDVDITEQIRSSKVTANSKYIASSEKLRKRLVKMQQDFAASQEKIVTEGRDQGTVAFADAGVKFFLVADINERARRRQAEPKAKGGGGNLKEIKEAIEKRDRSDEGRSVGSLKPADDAIIVDTTNLNIEEVAQKLLSYIHAKNV